MDQGVCTGICGSAYGVCLGVCVTFVGSLIALYEEVEITVAIPYYTRSLGTSYQKEIMYVKRFGA